MKYLGFSVSKDKEMAVQKRYFGLLYVLFTRYYHMIVTYSVHFHTYFFECSLLDWISIPIQLLDIRSMGQYILEIQVSRFKDEIAGISPELRKRESMVLRASTTRNDYNFPLFYRFLAHVLILAVAFGYMVAGGYVFCVIEGWKIDQNTESLLNGSSQLSESEMESIIIELRQRNHYHTDDLTRFDQIVSKLNKFQTTPPASTGWTLLDGFLYSYSTVTTIGYSHLYTATTFGRIYYVFYGLLGIILFALAISDIGLFIEEGILFVLHKINRNLKNKFGCVIPLDGTGWLQLPARTVTMIPVVLLCFLLYLALGGLLLPLWEREWNFVLGFYVAFDAITTVGIGDIYPRDQSMFLATILYFTFGIALACVGVGSLGDLSRRLHFIGIKPTNCTFEMVNFSGRSMPVHDLIEILGRELGVTDYEIKALRRSLDRLVRSHFSSTPSTIKRRQKTDMTKKTENLYLDTVPYSTIKS